MPRHRRQTDAAIDRQRGMQAIMVLLDVGVQAAQVANQSRVLGLVTAAQGRVNTLYMIGYFTGGSLGSLFATYGWSRWNWSGVCAVGIGLTTIAGLAAAGAWSDDVAWWALLLALVATWVSGLDYARVAPRVLRGESA